MSVYLPNIFTPTHMSKIDFILNAVVYESPGLVVIAYFLCFLSSWSVVNLGTITLWKLCSHQSFLSC